MNNNRHKNRIKEEKKKKKKGQEKNQQQMMRQLFGRLAWKLNFLDALLFFCFVLFCFLMCCRIYLFIRLFTSGCAVIARLFVGAIRLNGVGPRGEHT